MNASISSFLMVAKQFGASDLHLTVGVRPKVRIRGTLQEIAVADKIMPSDAKELVESMFKPRQKEIFDKYGEVDFAYAVPDIGRFRVNAFKQRGSYGAVLRLVGTEIPSPATLGIPISVVELTKSSSQAVCIALRVDTDLSLVNDRLIVVMKVLDRVFQRNNVRVVILVDNVDQGSQGR